MYSFAFLPAGKRPNSGRGLELGLDGVCCVGLRTWKRFDPAKVNAEFFSDGKWKANFLCNLGYGDQSKLFPRNSRLEFDEACRVL